MKIQQTTLRIPISLLNNLKEIADKQGYTLNGLILNILWEWIKGKGTNNNSLA